MSVFVVTRQLQGDTAVALCVCETLTLARTQAQRHLERVAAAAAVPSVQIVWTRIRTPTLVPWSQVEATAWHGAAIPHCDYLVTEHELVTEATAR